MGADIVINRSVVFRDAVSAAPESSSIGPSTEKLAALEPPVHKAGGHLRYLEGLRGLAAIVVAFQHIYFHTIATANLGGWQSKFRDGLGWLFPGRASVSVFIVLSGYLLMRPVVRAGTGRMPGGVVAYIYRRARRILPPYYVALIFAIAVILLVPALRFGVSGEWVDAVPPFGLKNLLAHFLLVHNLSYDWASKIDPPMWTIATEWQIYFLFPLLLLPAWRRARSAGVVAVGLGLGLGLFLLTGKGHAAAPWFLGLFAFGAAAAARERTGARRPYDQRIFGWLAAILFAIFGVITFECSFGMLRFLTVEGLPGLWPYYWAFDVLIGLGTACLLVFAAASMASGNKPHGLLHWLSSRWLVRAGVASYTLYLIHDPILAVLKLGLDRVHLGPFQQFAAMILVGGPIILAATYVFHIAFERPFMAAARVRGAER